MSSAPRHVHARAGGGAARPSVAPWPSCTRRLGWQRPATGGADAARVRLTEPHRTAGGRRDRRHGLHRAGRHPICGPSGPTSSTRSTRSPRCRLDAGTGDSTSIPTAAARDKIYSRWGGFIDEVPFDPLTVRHAAGLAELDRAVPAAGAGRRAGALDEPAIWTDHFLASGRPWCSGAGGGGGDLSTATCTRSAYQPVRRERA